MEASHRPGSGPVVVISQEVLGSHMAGPAIRYCHLARVLAREFDVVLAGPGLTGPMEPDGFSVLVYVSGQDPVLEDVICRARAVVVPAVMVAVLPALAAAGVPVVVDGYNPYLAETFFLQASAISTQQAALTQAYLLGDFFICGSERQRDWWLGLLEANGRINVYTHGEDASLRHLVDLVPFGLPGTPPQHTRQVIKGVWPGIGAGDRVVLWGGGLWPWFDPLTAIRALALIWPQRQDVRLVFPGTRHPNPGMGGIPTFVQAARALAAELGLLNRAVFFGEWMPHADWPNVLLESDVALALHGADSLETRLALRSRMLDYVWAGLPTVTTGGDAMSELLAKHGLGLVVPPGDAGGVADAILRCLETPRAAFCERAEQIRPTLTWEQVARPLIEFCRRPRRAPDKVALGRQLGNPYYMAQIDRLRAHLHAYKDHRLIEWLRRVGLFQSDTGPDDPAASERAGWA